MSETVTARDKVWAALLDNHAGYSFKLESVHRDLVLEHDQAPSEETVRRVLKSAAELGVVDHSSGSPHYRLSEEPKGIRR